MGEAARRHPDLIAAVAAAGHEIAPHTFDHTDITGRSAAEITRDLADTDAAIATADVTPAPLFRPPHGLQDVVAAEAVCATGRRTIGWWVNVNELTDPLITAIGPGTIVSAHDGRHDRSLDVAELDRLLTEIDRRDLHGVTVSRLLTTAGLDPPLRSGEHPGVLMAPER